ncbi:MAG: GNAT family N-acetyltransferase [Planctomycetota bacterium]|jgi:GNAT superfamily N-acetyltransferase
MRGGSLRVMTADDRDAVAVVICDSLNVWYTRHGMDELFPGGPDTCHAFFDTYEALDPGCGVVAEEDGTGRLMGVCFFHPRETHISLGIMAVHPDFFGRGAARALLNHIIETARHEGKSLRLVSSALNLDSFSLYTKAGFVPFCTYQDMKINVPQDGINEQVSGTERVRDATPDDIEEMAAVEMEVSGIQREKDYRYLIENSEQGWAVSVIEGEDGELDGFLASTPHAIGPGVARNEDEAAALLLTELNRRAGGSPVVLVPVECGDLVAHLYGWGARNCEVHMAQVWGDAQKFEGVSLPCFLPESG